MNSAAIRLDDENCHKLRKAHKKLRYQTEFEPLFANRKTARFSSNSASCRMLATSTMSAWRHGWARFRRSAARARTQRARRLRHRTSRGASQLRLEHSRESLESSNEPPASGSEGCGSRPSCDGGKASHLRGPCENGSLTTGTAWGATSKNRSERCRRCRSAASSVDTVLRGGHRQFAIQLSIGLRRGGELPDIAAIFIGVRQTADTQLAPRWDSPETLSGRSREILRRRARRTDGPPRYRPAFDTVPRREDSNASRAQKRAGPTQQSPIHSQRRPHRFA